MGIGFIMVLNGLDIKAMKESLGYFERRWYRLPLPGDCSHSRSHYVHIVPVAYLVLDSLRLRVLGTKKEDSTLK